jgi:hypothetical protein
MRNAEYIYLVLLSVYGSFSSCVRKELPVEPHQPGDEITATVSMGADYSWQLFYDLETNTVVSKNLKDTWHLGFEASAAGYRIILNTALPMFAYRTGKTDFSSVVIKDTIGKVRSWDSPTGSLDSTAIGDWRSANQVFIVDKGYSVALAHQGFKKIQVLEADYKKYRIRCADINGRNDQTIEVPKDSLYNFTFVSLGEVPAIVMAEPPKDSWDLVFTQYTHIFYDLNEPYLVTGCLLNRYSTGAFMDSFITFNEIDYAKAREYILSPFINTIGYDWKKLGSTGGGGSDYTMNIHMNYIIRTSSQQYFKLRFIDFYDKQVKGNPKWEFRKL